MPVYILLSLFIKGECFHAPFTGVGGRRPYPVGIAVRPEYVTRFDARPAPGDALSPQRSRNMTMMTVQRLHDLFEENPGRTSLSWQGTCHDCRGEVSITASCRSDAFEIRGGGIYEPEKNRFVLKCDRCFQKDPLLRHYQNCEVYSRVVGYLRPVGQWNDAKSAEFDDRRTFDASLR